jgi:hypothetical protein
MRCKKEIRHNKGGNEGMKRMRKGSFQDTRKEMKKERTVIGSGGMDKRI